ncbi:GNAT family N-acetyltransferase [Reichenbachiella carrageenanivorans]|uniref:GNAT family N-acetyltransferase n=1 Tax=Reichenbachiella carrageenanivorans TaxID=2979869 RepID=A0ABY6CX64_9BACT|nr:GNAT family N-acetyltransferase [Reichenbachiella carrageenanivorans]UXX77970.1 GNAT family N-acetyltransferase [Reichenbachiella carrageenanivorans]
MHVISSLTHTAYPALIEVWEASVRATHDFLPVSRVSELKPLILEQYFDAVQLFGVKQGNEVLGFLGVCDTAIEMLFIHPEARGKGVGKALLLYAVEVLHCTKVDVNEQNQQAVGFYAYMGFQIVGRSPFDGQGAPYPLLHMSLG